MSAREAHRILAFATTQFEGDRMVIAEYLLRPTPFVQTCPVHDGLEVWFEHVGKCLVLLPLTELVLAHEVRNYAS